MAYENTNKPQPSPELPPRRSIDKKDAAYAGPIFVAYRSNDFLDSNVQELKLAVETAGGEIDVHVFPAGSTNEEIQDWYNANAETLRGKRVITDWTSKYKGTEAKESVAALDFILTDAILTTIEKESGVSFNGVKEGSYGLGRVASPETVDQYDRMATGLFKVLFEKGKMRPGKIYLLKDRLTDHYPIPDTLDEGVNAAFNESPYPHIPSEVTTAVAERVRASIVAAGYPEENIVIIESSTNIVENGELVAKNDDWILVDRHVLKNASTSDKPSDTSLFFIQESLADMPSEERPALVLRFPLGDLLKDARDLGLLAIKGDDMHSAIKDSLERIPLK